MGRRDFHNQIAAILQRNNRDQTLTIEYSSLSGQGYRTIVERLENGELQTRFEHPPFRAG